MIRFEKPQRHREHRGKNREDGLNWCFGYRAKLNWISYKKGNTAPRVPSLAAWFARWCYSDCSLLANCSGNFSAKYLLKKVLTKDKRTGARINASNPATLNPGTKTEASQKDTPLTTNENAPKLNKLSGRDRVDKIGLINELTAPMETAAIKATGNVARSTPGKTISTTSRLSAVASKVKSVPIIIYPYFSIQLTILTIKTTLMPLHKDRFSVLSEGNKLCSLL